MAIRTKQIKREPIIIDAQATAPVSATSSGTFYPKTISGITEGFFIDDQGREVQITDNGKIKGTGGSVSISGAANLGGGSGVFAQVSGTDLQFKSIKAGSNVNVAASATELTISAIGSIASANNSSSGTGEGSIFKEASGSSLVFKKIKAGTNVTITNGTDDITISSSGGGGGGSGEINTASSVGTGAGIYAQKVGVDLQFKSLKVAGTNSISSDSDSITITGTGEINTASNLGTGTGIYAQKSSSDLQFKTLKAGTNVTITSDSTSLTINSTGGGSGEINTASNLGTGTGIYAQKVGVDLQLKSLKVAGSNSISSDSTSVTITGTGEANTASNASSGTGVGTIFKTKSGVDLVFKKIKAGTNVTITNGTDDITIDATGGGGGTGEVTQDIQFNSLSTGYVTIRATGLATDLSGVSVSKTANSVIVSGLTGTAKLVSLTVRFDASDITSGTATIQYPEANGETTLANSSMPTIVKFSAAGAQSTTAFSVGNSSGTITLSCSTLTSAAVNYVKVVF